MIDERACRLYAKMPEFRYLVSKTESFIAWALKQVQSPYVACSFGKDSSVMLDLVLRQIPNPHVKFVAKTETKLIDDYDSVINYWQCRGAEIQQINVRSRLEGEKKRVAESMQDSMFDSFFVGIRKEESVPRRITLSKEGKLFQMKDGKARIAPLADWTTRDIAAYMVSRNLPILQAYKREGFGARTAPGVTSHFPHEAVARLKDADIAAYNKLLSMFPGAKIFT